jgi:pimeloyl-ACP methyl ester carboxylesterase
MPAIQLPDAVAAALADPTLGTRMAIPAAGIPFSALTWGDSAARPLLMLHGVTSSAATWWRIAPALAALPRWVVAPDLPGHGRTGHWQGHHRFRDNAADLAAFAREAGLARADLQVVGHSWGAMTAAAFPAAGLMPATIVLLDPPAIPLARIALEASDPAQRTFEDIDEARNSSRPRIRTGPKATSRRRPRRSPSSMNRPRARSCWTTGTGTAASPISLTPRPPASTCG